MKTKTLYSLALATVAALAPDVHAQVSQQTLDAISAPDKVETRLGTLEYKDGVPTSDTVQKLYDNLDFMHAVDVYLNAFAGVSTYAAREGFRSIGVEDNQVVIFPRLMDSKSLFLTANADTVYFLGFLDLTKGPMVLETPPDSLGTLDDLWFNWVIDFGAPGPDAGWAANTSYCRRTTAAQFRKAASTSPAHAPHGCSFSAAPSSTRTTPSPRSS